MWKENLEGKTFGDLKIIGDTGKRTKRGRSIMLARNMITDTFFESASDTFRAGKNTGFKGSERHKDLAKESIRKTIKNLNDEQKRVMRIKQNITRYKKGKGVYFKNERNKWNAVIRINGKLKHLGSFNTEAEAKEARKKAVDEQIKILEEQLNNDRI